jgi:hypothetical protein
MPSASLPTRLAIRARGAAARTLHLLGLGLDAATLGLLSDAQLDALTAAFYEESTSYTSEEQVHFGLYEWEREAVEEFFPRGGRVLVTSSGGGREALALLERGHDVVATECVERLHRALAANLAAASPGAAVALLLPPDAVPTERGPFDAAMIGWTAYTHMTGREVRVAFLRRLRAALRPGAPVLVSYWSRAAGVPRALRAKADLANALRRLLGRRPVEIGETTADGHHQRRCAPGEVPAEAREAGFEVLAERLATWPHVVLRAPPAPSTATEA